MLKIPRKCSVTLSMILAAFFMVVLVVTAFYLPQLVHRFVDMRYPEGNMESWKPLVLTNGYLILAAGGMTDFFLCLLLLRVRKGWVFTAESVALVRGISWSAVLVGLLFIPLGRFFNMAYLIAFVTLYLGISMRVVKNVIEEATAIKNENDLTV